MVNIITELPMEIKAQIAELDVQSYYGMISIDRDICSFYSGIEQQLTIKNKLTQVVYRKNGSIYYMLNNMYHRENDLPAIITANGAQMWYRYGKLHRDGDLPAIIHEEEGTQIWYKNGVLHRDGDLPAKITSSIQIWYKNGLEDRDNGPAYIYERYHVYYWMKNGKFHRIGGPAIIDDQRELYYKNGEKDKESDPNPHNQPYNGWPFLTNNDVRIRDDDEIDGDEYLYWDLQEN